MTTPLSPDALLALGLPPDAQLRPAGAAAPADDGVAHGLASAPAAPDDLRAALRSITPIDFFPALAARIGAPEADLGRVDGHRGIFLLAFPGLDLTAGPGLRPIDDERVAVDASARPVDVRVRGPLGDGVLRFDGDHVAGFEVVRRPSPAAPADLTPPPAPDALLGGFDAPAWMTDPLRPSPPRGAYAACAAVATLGRLWSPRKTGTPAAAAMARLRADDHPWARARRWFDALPAGHRALVGELARAECDALTDALDGLTDDGFTAADAVALLERRDDLASVAALLRTSPDDPLGSALAALDREAGLRASAWRRLAPLSSARLEAVAWQSPEAWWAALAGPA